MTTQTTKVDDLEISVSTPNEDRTELPEATKKAIADILKAIDVDHLLEMLYDLKGLDPLAAHWAHLLNQKLHDLAMDEEVRPIINSLVHDLSSYHKWEWADAVDRY